MAGGEQQKDQRHQHHGAELHEPVRPEVPRAALLGDVPVERAQAAHEQEGPQERGPARPLTRSPITLARSAMNARVIGRRSQKSAPLSGCQW